MLNNNSLTNKQIAADLLESMDVLRFTLDTFENTEEPQARMILAHAMWHLRNEYMNIPKVAA